MGGEHPIAGVISLLQKLEIQSKEEGAAEAASFQKFTYWCKTSTRTLNKAIATEKSDISSLTDKIEGLTADISSLTEDIAALKADIEEMETAADKAKTMRSDEKDLYDEEQWEEWYKGKGKDAIPYVAVSTGILQRDMEKLDKILAGVPHIPMICIDVANGYAEAFVKCIRDVRNKHPTKTI